MANIQVIDQFLQKVQGLHEVEYGDFRRKLGLYINRMEQGLGYPNGEARALIAEMRQIVIYNPKPEIDWVREETIEIANKLKKVVH